MRITILGINYAPERTGVAPYTTGLARHLGESHDVTVITGLPHYPDWRVPDEFARVRTEQFDGPVRVVRVPHHVPSEPTVLGRGLYEASWAARATREGRRVPADLVLAVVPALLGATAGVHVARKAGAPLGLIVQDVMGSAARQSGMSGGGVVSRLTTHLERAALREADGVATIHPRLAAELARCGAKSPTVIYNWTHVEQRAGPRRSLRKRYHWREEEIIALHSGNMGAKQNLENVIDAARLAQSADRPVRFVFAGGGNQEAKLREYASDCANVSFLPAVADADFLDFLGSADVLLVNERPGMGGMSLPSKLTSYLIAGRPIVAATDPASATSEFVNASGGVLVPAGSPGRLLDQITRVATDPTLAASLSSLGREFAERSLARSAALQSYTNWVAKVGGSATHFANGAPGNANFGPAVSGTAVALAEREQSPRLARPA